VGLSANAAERNLVLKEFLRERLYHHPRIERMKDKSRRILRSLFDRYMENPRLLSEDVRRRMDHDGAHRAVADFIAGMTDRYAAEEYLRLFDPTVRV
jgi:dGTPase